MNLVFASGFLVPQSILGVDYFRGLPAHFPNALFPTTAIDAHVKDRAKALATEINRRFPDGEIHIIAHSMGGLDSRYLLSKNLLGLAGRVKSLSTISTPHWGSPVADLVLDLVPGVDSTLVRRALNQFPAVQSGALDDLTTEAAVGFNKENVDVKGIRYLSYCGTGTISLLLQPTHAFIASVGKTDEEQANDGMVSQASAKWPSDFVEPPWPADHLAEVGHNLDTLDFTTTFDHKAAFDRVVQRATGAAIAATA